MKNIYIIGMPNSGKTTIGKMVSLDLNIRFIDLDEYIEENTKSSISELFCFGEEYFRKVETAYLKEVSKLKDSMVSTGGGIVIKDENLNILRKGVVIFIDRPIEMLKMNLALNNRPLFKNGIKTIEDLYNERYDIYLKNCHHHLINDDSIVKIAEEIKKIVRKRIESISNQWT